MPEFNAVHMFYALMIIGMLFTFVLTKRQTKDIRKECDRFAIPFVKLSNYISPSTQKQGLAVEETEDGGVKPLPFEQQSEAMQFIIRRANSDKSVKLFAKLTVADEKIFDAAGVNRTWKSQFCEPIHKILLMTHTFLEGCENLNTINSRDKLEDFNSFLQQQVEHRMVLLNRISGSKSDEYYSLNHNYREQMAQAEKEQEEQRRKGGRKKKDA